jgi:diketogulonate reductase-like aldo/keto reductase
MIERKIPSSGETLPVIGLGTWQSFDVSSTANVEPLSDVLATMSRAGGKLIDSSPMYGRSETIIGILTDKAPSDQFFYATKVWTTGKEEGIRQMESSFSKFRRPVIDLMQIHNLVDWKTHLHTLLRWKEEGRIRYVGITHYMDSMHDELAKIIRSEKIDFVQFNYSIFHRHAEANLLKTAEAHGVATLINRPFSEGKLFEKMKEKQLPMWAKEFELHSWSQFFLKFIISHPAVTCVIPATSNPAHAEDNLKAGTGPLPDGKQRQRMVEFVEGV